MSTNLLLILLILSMAINVFIVWFARRITIKFLFLSENLDDLVKIIANYKNHLKTLYATEMFYGDETLSALIDHTRSLSDVLEDYEATDDILSSLTDIEGEEDDNTATEAEEESQIQKDVFYAGSRRRDS